VKIVTIINATGRCGKSTIAMNLAVALVGEGYRAPVIII
jgi:cellulose biosynthesis protein BcsQ